MLGGWFGGFGREGGDLWGGGLSVGYDYQKITLNTCNLGYDGFP